MLKFKIRVVTIVDEGSWGDPRGSPMGLNVGVKMVKMANIHIFMRKSQKGKAWIKLLEKS